MEKSKNQSPLRIFLITQITCLFFINLYLFFRIRWDIFDVYCPTFLINLIDKITINQHIIDHLGIPGLNFNYHFLTLYTTSIFTRLGLSSLTSLTILITISFNLLYILLFKYSNPLRKLFKKKGLFLLPIFLIVNLFSSSTFYIFSDFKSSYFAYISVAEYFLSISWPLTFIIISIQFIILRKGIEINTKISNKKIKESNKIKKYYFLSVLTLTLMPFINPLAFIISSSAHILFYVFNILITISLFKISLIFNFFQNYSYIKFDLESI